MEKTDPVEEKTTHTTAAESCNLVLTMILFGIIFRLFSNSKRERLASVSRVHGCVYRPIASSWKLEQPGKVLPSQPQSRFWWNYLYQPQTSEIVDAYIFARPKKRNTKKTATAKVPVEAEDQQQHITDTSSEISAPEEILEPVAVVAPVRILQPIPEEQQRELFKWMLDEKRKTKPKDAQEKRRIDQEKAVLKDFIRSESIPSLYTESVATD